MLSQFCMGCFSYSSQFLKFLRESQFIHKLCGSRNYQWLLSWFFTGKGNWALLQFPTKKNHFWRLPSFLFDPRTRMDISGGIIQSEIEGFPWWLMIVNASSCGSEVPQNKMGFLMDQTEVCIFSIMTPNIGRLYFDFWQLVVGAPWIGSG